MLLAGYFGLVCAIFLSFGYSPNKPKNQIESL